MPSRPPLSCRPRISSTEVAFRVWAPHAEGVELVVEAGEAVDRTAMTAAASGCFECVVPRPPAEARYGYSVDGGPPRPDPVTMCQPEGVHRLSALHDVSTFSWGAPNPDLVREDLVIYELHIGAFTEAGTFEAAIDRLDDLVELGVTAIEILPVAQCPGTRNWGYDGVHPYAAQNTYGGPGGICQLVDAAHARGLAVILDVVFNHLGPEGNYLGEFGPYFTDRHPTPWGSGFDFDGPDSRGVRAWVLDCVRHWILDFRFDGLRLDAVHAMKDDSTPHILTEIKRVADEAAAERGGACVIIAESLLNDVAMVQSIEDGGLGLDAEWNEDLHHAVTAWLTGELHGKYVDYGDTEAIANVLENGYHLDGRHSQFYDRNWGAPAGPIGGDRFVVSLQNHDHIGNRARGDRLATMIDGPRLRLGACLTILSPFLPMIFMGEEYGETRPFPFFCDFQDPRVVSGVRRGRRRDYDLEGSIPDPFDEATFHSSRLSWSWDDDPERDRHRRLYRELFALRRDVKELRDSRRRPIRWHDTAGGRILELPRGGRISCWFRLGKGEDQLPPDADVIWRSEKSPSIATEPIPTKLLSAKPDAAGNDPIGSFECVVLRKR